MEILKIAVKLKKRVVIGTTGFTKRDENLIQKYSKKIPILKAGNMSLGINLLMYLTEITSKSLGDAFLSKIFEIHHKYKKDAPSGTALSLGEYAAKGRKILLTTKTGVEGIDLKNVRQVHVVEPYWNPVRIKQVKGRAVRVGSHLQLPPKDRTVDIFFYLYLSHYFHPSLY